MAAYYNEHDPHAAAWLRELIKAGLIAPGDVDEQSICDVRASDLVGYTQCHFFAGIGVWSYALRQAGWPDDRPVWTGSCPCQPFSAAGKGGGFDDERHLWPDFFRLIRERRPGAVFGEQVASKDGLAWLDIVQADMESADYAFGAFDLCAAGVGAPHIRQRQFFVAERLVNPIIAGLEGQLRNGNDSDEPGWNGAEQAGSAAKAGESGGLADSNQCQHHGGRHIWETGRGEFADDGATGGLGDTERDGCVAATLAGSNGQAVLDNTGGAHDTEQLAGASRSGDVPVTSSTVAAGPTNGFWRDADWLFCRDGKWRPVEPGTSPLVNEPPKRMVRGSNSSLPFDANNTSEARVMRLRGYGNAINAEVAIEFITAYMERGQL